MLLSFSSSKISLLYLDSNLNCKQFDFKQSNITITYVLPPDCIRFAELWMQVCTTAQKDYRCVVPQYLRGLPTGGLVEILGPSRSTFLMKMSLLFGQGALAGVASMWAL